MNQDELLARQFESHRPHLRAVAYRMLGSDLEAEDAVQEAWLRLSRNGADDVANLGGWLTTVVARVCLDLLRSRRARPESSLDGYQVVAPDDLGHPEHDAVLADSVGVALLVVLETLTPAERLAFVLHDLFAVPFDELAPILGRTPTAVRQLASRGRRRVQTGDTSPEPDRGRQRQIVSAFLAASRAGDFTALMRLLDPDAAVRADAAAVAAGASSETRGAHAVAQTFCGRAQAARLALVDGEAGAIWAVGGKVRVAFGFTVEDGRIVEIELIADPEQLGRLELEFLGS